MDLSRIALRGTVAAGALALLAGGMLGCAPDPDPDPTPTAAFASEEEAFAAAEEVYRDYIAAGNGGEDVKSFLSGVALDGQIETERYLAAEKITLQGDTEVISFLGTSSDIGPSDASITAAACIDITQTQVLNSAGVDVTPKDRDPRVALNLKFTGTPAALLISESEVGDSAC